MSSAVILSGPETAISRLRGMLCIALLDSLSRGLAVRSSRCVNWWSKQFYKRKAILGVASLSLNVVRADFTRAELVIWK